MTRPTDRRTILVAAGAAAIAAAAGTAAAQQTEIHGSVTFKGGTTIPTGNIDIYLEDLAIQDRTQRRVAEIRVGSDGKSTAISFSLARPASAIASPTLRIVARLERADGWLVARGSVQSDLRAPVDITLNEAMY